MENGNKELIWIVEGEVGLSKMMEIILSKEKRNFVIFHKCEDAVAKLDALKNTTEGKPDLIITDNNTKSEKSGMEVLEKAREIGGIRTIMQSSDSVEYDANSKGAMAFISKPYTSNVVLANLVEETLAKPAPSYKTAWVVDDNADIRMPLKDALEFRGFTVREFDSTTAAIKALAESKPDIIITDLDTKTKENGIDVIKAATPMGVKSILWTAGSDFHKISINAKNAGAAEVFEKPGNIGKIAARAEELVSNPEREPAAIAR